MLYLIQVLATTSEEVKKMITVLDEMFDSLKENVQQSLEKRVVPVKKIANALTSLSADYDDHHRMFLKSNVTELYTSVDHSVLFGHMNFHWNYLDPSLLNHLVGKFGLKEVKDEMEAYKSHLRQFRMKTPLRLFCLAQKKKRVRFSPGFQEVVAEFSWPEEHEITLEEVEQFRQEFASNFNLRDFAMMLIEVRPGSFVVTWVIPQSIVEEMKKYVPKIILRKFFVAKLVIAGSCIYCRHSAEVYFSYIFPWISVMYFLSYRRLLMMHLPASVLYVLHPKSMFIYLQWSLCIMDTLGTTILSIVQRLSLLWR